MLLPYRATINEAASASGVEFARRLYAPGRIRASDSRTRSAREAWPPVSRGALNCALSESRSSHSPDGQPNGHDHGDDREDRKAQRGDERDRERGDEPSADEGAGEELAVAVAANDAGLPGRIDHVDHHESGRDVALSLAELGDRVLEPVPLEDSPADDQHEHDAPGDRRHGEDHERADVVAERAQRERADRADDDPVDREPSETLHGPTVHRPAKAGADRGELNEDAADDREREERKLLEEIRAEEVEEPAEELEEHDPDGDRDTERYRRCRHLAHALPFVHRLLVRTREVVIDVQVLVRRRRVLS